MNGNSVRYRPMPSAPLVKDGLVHVVALSDGLHVNGSQLVAGITRRLPEEASVARSPRARRGKVYIDALQNGYGKLLVAPYSVRPLSGAPVSMQLNWREVNGKLEPGRFTIATAPARMDGPSMQQASSWTTPSEFGRPP